MSNRKIIWAGAEVSVMYEGKTALAMAVEKQLRHTEKLLRKHKDLNN
jgi:mevalonate kinase